MEVALYQCQGCKHKLRLMVNGPKMCQRCGGTFERVLHPLQAYDEIAITPSLIEKRIEIQMAALIPEIYERLQAEVEMDKFDSLVYNERKEGGQGGEESDNSD